MNFTTKTVFCAHKIADTITDTITDTVADKTSDKNRFSLFTSRCSSSHG